MNRHFFILSLIFFSSLTCCGQGGWVWAKRGFGQNIAGGPASIGQSTATDHSGNVFVTGPYYGNYITLDTITLGYDGYSNFFIAKYDSSGNIVWAKSFGGHYLDESKKIATDSNGNVIVTGQLSSSPVNFGNTTLYGLSTDPLYSQAEFFIVKLDSDGNVLWVRSAKGNDYDAGEDLAFDISGNIYVSGSFQSSELTFDNITISPNKNTNGDYLMSAFIVKYDGNGKVIWVKTFGADIAGGYNSYLGDGNCVALNSKGQIYLTGAMNIENSNDMMPAKAYLAKFDPEGNLIWSKIFEGGGVGNYSYSSEIAIDALDKVYLAGSFYQTLFIGKTTLSNNISNPGNSTSIFVAKFDSNGNSIWAKSATQGRGISSGITATESGSLFITGTLPLAGLNRDTIDFGAINLVSTIQNTSRDNAFVAQYDSAGTALWATFINSGNMSLGRDITTDNYGNVLVTGVVTSSYISLGGLVSFGDIPIPPWNFSGMFIAKLRPCNKPSSVNSLEAICSGNSITLTSPSSIFNAWNTGEISPSILVKTPGDYIVTISNSSSCKLQIKTTTVIVNSLPQAKIVASTEILCKGGNATITANEAVSYVWNTGAVSQSISTSNAGPYHVRVIDANGCSATSESVELKYIESLPEVTLLSDCTKIFINQDLNVTWLQNDEIIKLDSSLKEFYPPDSGYYHVEISNECGTKKSNIIYFIPADTHFLVLPNVITPNGDSFNEFFVLDEKLSGSALQVINRWGKEVFFSQHYDNNWNANDLSSGIYYYVISNSCFTEKLKGVITIVR